MDRIFAPSADFHFSPFPSWITVLNDIRRSASVFRLFSTLRRLPELKRREAAELHRLALLAESLHAMMYRSDLKDLGDFVMRSIYTNVDVMCLNSSILLLFVIVVPVYWSLGRGATL
ncbi:hypothetical protein OESDEN_25604 [Oesophagostomum dentatum]|uniref:Uncharacterized protein n=1 Tax=Oesophagostomum dentatum TaxID=61180 RepID=A0A0B1RUQ7_OESDE|nr:hypothetical protein OESDEN_25604 [Oesophagostomum dentatum]